MASPGPLDTTLPSVTSARLTRPAIGEVDAREFEIELHRAQRRLGGRNLRRRFGRERRAAIVLLERHRVLGAQPLGALQFAGPALHGRASAHQFGAQADRPRR